MRHARRLSRRAYEAAARSDDYRASASGSGHAASRRTRSCSTSRPRNSRQAATCAAGSVTTRVGGRGSSSSYRRELRPPAPRERLYDLARRAAERAVTVVYDTRDEQHNDAAVIRDEIARRLRTRTARYARHGAA